MTHTGMYRFLMEREIKIMGGKIKVTEREVKVTGGPIEGHLDYSYKCVIEKEIRVIRK